MARGKQDTVSEATLDKTSAEPVENPGELGLLGTGLRIGWPVAGLSRSRDTATVRVRWTTFSLGWPGYAGVCE